MFAAPLKMLPKLPVINFTPLPAYQLLMLRKLNLKDTEWTACLEYNRGLVSVALVLDYCKPSVAGVWFGMCVELRSGTTTLCTQRTKLHYVRPNKNQRCTIRLIRSHCYAAKRPRQVLLGHAATAYQLEVSMVLLTDCTEQYVRDLLLSNERLLESCQWPTEADRRPPLPPNGVILFQLGYSVPVHLESVLGRLQLNSPLRDWYLRPERGTQYQPTLHREPGRLAVDLFLRYAETGCCVRDELNEQTLYDVLLLVRFFKCPTLLQLCEVRLIELLRAHALPYGEWIALEQLKIPALREIFYCQRVLQTVQPEISTAEVTYAIDDLQVLQEGEEGEEEGEGEAGEEEDEEEQVADDEEDSEEDEVEVLI